MHDALHLVRTRRFLPLFTTQFLGAFNDNLFRTAMVMLVIYGIYRDAEQEATFSAIAGGLFILPFFLLSALAGQLADAHGWTERTCTITHSEVERWVDERVVEWWDSVWRSPMASEFLDVDRRGGLYLIADLYQARWTADSASAIANISKEIRLQEARFGLSPIDRRRLQWEVARGEEAERLRHGGGRLRITRCLFDVDCHVEQRLDRTILALSAVQADVDDVRRTHFGNAAERRGDRVAPGVRRRPAENHTVRPGRGHRLEVRQDPDRLSGHAP